MVRRFFRQLLFDFETAPVVQIAGLQRQAPVEQSAPESPVKHLDLPSSVPRDFLSSSAKLRGADEELESQARVWLNALGLPEGAAKVSIHWNPRMRSTAGYARWPQWYIELNPKLAEFEGQIERTLKHELAHLIAYARAGRRKIEPHGDEWRLACAELGIADESARHTLPLPRRKQTRKFIYSCPACALRVERVRKFKRHTACLACCKKHSGGQYDHRFQFVLIAKPD